MSEPLDLSARLRELQQAFDGSFAQARAGEAPKFQNILAIRVGGRACALRVHDVGGLHVDRPIMPLPTHVPELLGLTAFRGMLAPVYDLAALLGHAAAQAPRWLALVQRPAPFALAFELFEAHARVPIASLPAGADGASEPSVVVLAGAPRSVIDVARLLQIIRAKCTQPTPSKET